jgi:hypothetical protein
MVQSIPQTSPKAIPFQPVWAPVLSLPKQVELCDADETSSGVSPAGRAGGECERREGRASPPSSHKCDTLPQGIYIPGPVSGHLIHNMAIST